jgi:uncharacterized protein YndB with AHSA1/START domain
MSNVMSEPLRLRLERSVRATPERCFRAWTTPDELRRWSAPEGLEIGEGAMDLRVGGAWRVVMEGPDGARHEAFGTYLEITPPTRLVYTHAWRQAEGSSPETRVTVEFLPDCDRTRVVLTQVGFGSAGSRDGHETGWSSTLDQLERMLGEEAA